MRPRLCATALALVLLTALAGCTDDPVPIIESSPEPSATATPTPTPEPTPTDQPTSEQESAKEFIRRWQAAAYEMQISGDSGPYRALTLNCEGCDNFAQTVDQINRDGGSIRLDEPSVGAISRVGRSDGVQIFEFDTVTSPTKVLDAEGNIVRNLEGGRSRFQTNLARDRSGDWKVTRVSELVP